MVKLGSGLMVLGGVAHMGITLWQTVPLCSRAWFGRQLWTMPEITEMTAANSGFWVSIGSWAVPQARLGMTLPWLDRRGIVPSVFIPCALAAYMLALGLYSPQPMVYGALIVSLLLLGTWRAQRRTDPTVGEHAHTTH